MSQDARTVSSATVSATVIRACPCGSCRQPGSPCAAYGNTAKAKTHDLGIVSATYRNPVKQAWWLLLGRHFANFRIRKANRSAV